MGFLSHLHNAHLKSTIKSVALIKTVTLKAVSTPRSRHTRVKHTRNTAGRSSSQKSLVVIMMRTMHKSKHYMPMTWQSWKKLLKKLVRMIFIF